MRNIVIFTRLVEHDIEWSFVGIQELNWWGPSGIIILRLIEMFSLTCDKKYLRIIVVWEGLLNSSFVLAYITRFNVAQYVPLFSL